MCLLLHYILEIVRYVKEIFFLLSYVHSFRKIIKKEISNTTNEIRNGGVNVCITFL
jgi:hypothetical protein